MKRTFTLLFFTCIILVTVLFSAREYKPQKYTFTNSVIRNASDETKEIAFACNVDWGSEVIPQMLEIFDQEDINISFFVTGNWARKNPSLLREMFLHNHEIGNHGYSHKLCSQISKDLVKEEITKTEDIVNNLIGIKPTLFEPPSGDFDNMTVRICDELGYTLVLWSIDTIDWRQGSTADIIKKRVLDKTLNGAIVLMHPKPETVKALPSIISEIKTKGIDIVPVSQLIRE